MADTDKLSDERLREIVAGLEGYVDDDKRVWYSPGLIRAAFTELLSRRTSTGEAVAVKPLEWRVPTDHPSDPDIEENVYCADGIGGRYAISRKQKTGPERLLWMADDPFAWKGFTSIAEAKAAAQTDYEARIRSALVLAVDDAMVERVWEVVEPLLHPTIDRRSAREALTAALRSTKP